MRKLRLKIFEPWRTMSGWEFDLLRTLAPATANSLYRRAWVVARKQLKQSWWWWAWLGAMFVALVLSMVTLLFVGAALGLGKWGQIVLDVAFHLTVGLMLFHPLHRLLWRLALPPLRAALAEELLEFVQNKSLPDCRETGQ